MPLIFNKPLVLGKKSVFNPDAFRITGSPDISADGIMTRYGTNSGVLTSVKMADLKNKDFEIITPVLTAELASSALIDGDAYGYGAFFQLRSLVSRAALYIRTGNAEENRTVNISMDITAYNGKQVQYKIGYIHHTGTYSLYIKEKEASEWILGASITVQTADTNIYLYSPVQFISIGKNVYADYNTNPLELKYTRIISNGAEIFSGSKLITPEWEAKPFKFDVKSINA